MDRRPATLASFLLALAAVGCGEEARAIDPFPIRFDNARGAVVIGANAGDGTVPAVLDTLAPVTVIDPVAAGRPAEEARRRRVEITLLGLDQDGLPTVPRARFPDTSAIELHPCPGDALCRIGNGPAAVEFGALLGTDILGRASLRIDFAARELRFFPEMAGTEADLTSDCQAVFSSAFAGGGTILVGGTEVPYSGRRAVVGACLDQIDAPDDVERGTDTLLAISTGTGITLLTASAYDRYAAATGAPGRRELVAGLVSLASGPTEVLFTEIGRAALVGSLSEESGERGPCRELFLNRLMSVDACTQQGIDPARVRKKTPSAARPPRSTSPGRSPSGWCRTTIRSCSRCATSSGLSGPSWTASWAPARSAGCASSSTTRTAAWRRAAGCRSGARRCRRSAARARSTTSSAAGRRTSRCPTPARRSASTPARPTPPPPPRARGSVEQSRR